MEKTYARNMWVGCVKNKLLVSGLQQGLGVYGLLAFLFLNVLQANVTGILCCLFCNWKEYFYH